MKNAGLADPLLRNMEVQEGHKKHREHNFCRQNAALCVGIRVVVVLFGTVVLDKIVPIPLFQIWELILTDRNCYDWLKKYTVIEVVARENGGCCARQKGSFDGHNLGHNHKSLYLCPRL